MGSIQSEARVERHDAPMQEIREDFTLKNETFTLNNETVENMRPMKVIVVGAGLCGIYAAIRFPERLRNVELVVYEKGEKVGGVW